MKTLTNRLTAEQMAEWRKRQAEHAADTPVSPPVAVMKTSVKRTYNPVGANVGLSTQYKR